MIHIKKRLKLHCLIEESVNHREIAEEIFDEIDKECYFDHGVEKYGLAEDIIDIIEIVMELNLKE